MTPPTEIFDDRRIAERQVKNAASWFYWIAGVTVVYVIMELFGSDYVGLIGLSLPSIFAMEKDSGSHIVAIVLTVLAVALYGGIGFGAGRGYRWVFIVGIVFYAIDTVIYALCKEWVGTAVHAYVGFRLIVGIPAAARLGQIRKAEKAAAATAAGPQIGAWYSAPQPAAAVQSSWESVPSQEPATQHISPPEDPVPE